MWKLQPGEGPSRGLLRDFKPLCGPSFDALMVSWSQDEATATLTLSSLHSFFFLLCSMNYELEIFQLQHSTCFWNLTVGCEAADRGLGAGARTSRRFIIILLSLLLLPTSQVTCSNIIFACLPTQLFLKLFLLHISPTRKYEYPEDLFLFLE